jgi:hypothetical protein
MNYMDRITDERSSGHVLQDAETGGRTKHVKSNSCVYLFVK